MGKISNQDIIDGCEKTADRIREKLEAETGQEWRVFYMLDGPFPKFLMFTSDYCYESPYHRQISNWRRGDKSASDYFVEPLEKLSLLFDEMFDWSTRLVLDRFPTREGSNLVEYGRQKWEWAKSFEGKRMEAI